MRKSKNTKWLRKNKKKEDYKFLEDSDKKNTELKKCDLKGRTALG